jgi:hypothetical protein
MGQTFASLGDFERQIGRDPSQPIVFKLQLGNQNFPVPGVWREIRSILPTMQCHDADAQRLADGDFALSGSQKLGGTRQLRCDILSAMT